MEKNSKEPFTIIIFKMAKRHTDYHRNGVTEACLSLASLYIVDLTILKSAIPVAHLHPP